MTRDELRREVEAAYAEIRRELEALLACRLFSQRATPDRGGPCVRAREGQLREE